MTTLVEDMITQVARLTVAGVEATADPRIAAQAPGVIVLVQPPQRDYVQLLQTWTVAVLRNSTDTGLPTTEALGEVLAVLEASDIPIESARPGGLRFSPEKAAVPAYFVTYTTP